MAKILRDKEIVGRLAEEFKEECSYRQILYALDCKYDSELAKRIRVRALAMGAKVKGSITVRVHSKV
jgi:hypothetical protein